tara:strand:+ start:19 stop:1224 length:1206 start_codon:yes stop_codon:yes gene_type:complete
MATFTLPQMISRLTKGFVKVTGRMPDGLEKIKIKQEALEKIKQQDKVVDMKGNVIDTSKGIMGGEQVGMFDNIFNKMQKQMGKGDPKIVKPKKPDPEKKAMGGRIGYAEGTPSFEEYLKERQGIEKKENFERLYKEYLDDLRRKKVMQQKQEAADGGRIGLKLGMNRRAFLKLMGGVGAGIGALKTGLLKFAGKGAASKITKDIIKTDAVPGKPEWFDALVTKVINEGTDVTKKLATQERESVHRLNIDKFEDVTVYRNTDTGEIRVSYESPTNVGEESVDLVYKKPLADEGDPRPSAEFYAVEPEPRVMNPDGDMEFDGENLVNSIDDLMSDTSRLKIIARGDNKPTIKEFVESKRKKDKTKAINEDPVQQAEYLEEKYGPAPDNEPDFASGGVARLLGE